MNGAPELQVIHEPAPPLTVNNGALSRRCGHCNFFMLAADTVWLGPLGSHYCQRGTVPTLVIWTQDPT